MEMEKIALADPQSLRAELQELRAVRLEARQ